MKNLESDGGQGERVKKEREISVFLEIKRDESDRDILWVLRERKEKKKKIKKKKKTQKPNFVFGCGAGGTRNCLGLYSQWSYTSCFFLMPWGFIPSGLTLALVSCVMLMLFLNISFHIHISHIISFSHFNHHFIFIYQTSFHDHFSIFFIIITHSSSHIHILIIPSSYLNSHVTFTI
jgi:hypothetical protein